MKRWKDQRNTPESMIKKKHTSTAKWFTKSDIFAWSSKHYQDQGGPDEYPGQKKKCCSVRGDQHVEHRIPVSWSQLLFSLSKRSRASSLTEYPQNLKTKKSRTTARESSAEKGSKSSSDASCPVDDRGHRCKRFTRALSAVALSTWNFSCSLKEFQTVAGALLEPFL